MHKAAYGIPTEVKGCGMRRTVSWFQYAAAYILLEQRRTTAMAGFDFDCVARGLELPSGIDLDRDGDPDLLRWALSLARLQS